MRKKRKISPLLVVFDFDGVLTDNKVIVCQDGTESVLCDRSDGLGMEMLRKSGIPMLILSKEVNPVVSARGKKLNVPVVQGVQNKLHELKLYCKKLRISLEDVLYVGNDLNDLEVMKHVGVSACPADAHKAIKKISSIVLSRSGGGGAVRELIEVHLGINTYEQA